ncbi:MAG: hypothetical protein HXY47_08105 [Nitrospirae bacterium]|nr:hypothetical protein [Nitrospirota bacterium]
MLKFIMTVSTTVNASFRILLSEEALAQFIKKGEFPEQFREHNYVFFTEVPVSLVYKFMLQYEISLKILKDYYMKFIEPVYHNKDFERMFDV